MRKKTAVLALIIALAAALFGFSGLLVQGGYTKLVFPVFPSSRHSFFLFCWQARRYFR